MIRGPRHTVYQPVLLVHLLLNIRFPLYPFGEEVLRLLLEYFLYSVVQNDGRLVLREELVEHLFLRFMVVSDSVHSRVGCRELTEDKHMILFKNLLCRLLRPQQELFLNLGQAAFDAVDHCLVLFS